MHRLFVFVVAALVAMVLGCTEQQRAKGWGGNASIKLPCGRKLVVATWKQDDLWYLTRAMRADETPESYPFSESSSWGVMQGAVTFTECK